MAMFQKFQKPPLGRQKLIDLMKNRGLSLQENLDQARAREAISKIGYYRLSGYMPIFQVGGPGANKHDYVAGTTLENILDLYNFDTELRGHLSAGLEIIEVAFRTSVCDHMCRRTQNSHWMLDEKNFRPGTHQKNLEEFRDASVRSTNKGESIESYFRKYDDPLLPAAWMIRENLSFGKWSHIYADLVMGDQKAISDDWLYPYSSERIDHALLAKWIRSLVILRNTCAHHSRVTHRIFSIPTEASTHNSVKYLFGPDDADLRSLIVVLAIMLKNVKPNNMWLKQLFVLFDGHTRRLDVGKSTGFSTAWQIDAVWSF